MIKLLTFLIAPFIVLSINYFELLGKDISTEEVKSLLEELGSDYEYDDSYEVSNFYIYEERGVELSFSKQNKLKAIFFKVNNLDSNIELPLGIEATDTRQEVENKIGIPDRTYRSMSDFRAYYINENVIVRYKDRDRDNMNNSIKSVSVEKVKEE